jgi:arsenate reductase
MNPQNTQISMFHNPRCSKSRQTLQLLKDRGLEPSIIQYINTPPDKQALNDILKLLNMEPRDLMRSKERVYKELGLADPALSRDDLLQAMLQHPVLIERPIVIANGKAALGRPPEIVLKIL